MSPACLLFIVVVLPKLLYGSPHLPPEVFSNGTAKIHQHVPWGKTIGEENPVEQLLYAVTEDYIKNKEIQEAPTNSDDKESESNDEPVHPGDVNKLQDFGENSEGIISNDNSVLPSEPEGIRNEPSASDNEHHKEVISLPTWGTDEPILLPIEDNEFQKEELSFGYQTGARHFPTNDDEHHKTETNWIANDKVHNQEAIHSPEGNNENYRAEISFNTLDDELHGIANSFPIESSEDSEEEKMLPVGRRLLPSSRANNPVPANDDFTSDNKIQEKQNLNSGKSGSETKLCKMSVSKILGCSVELFHVNENPPFFYFGLNILDSKLFDEVCPCPMPRVDHNCPKTVHRIARYMESHCHMYDF